MGEKEGIYFTRLGLNNFIEKFYKWSNNLFICKSAFEREVKPPKGYRKFNIYKQLFGKGIKNIFIYAQSPSDANDAITTMCPVIIEAGDSPCALFVGESEKTLYNNFILNITPKWPIAYLDESQLELFSEKLNSQYELMKVINRIDLKPQ